MYCHTKHLKCLRMLELPAFSAARPSSRKCSKDSDCSPDMYCHASFKLCLPAPQQPTTTTVKKSCCKRDRDCGRNQYCHKWFKLCLDVLTIPTVTTRTSIVRKCQNRSQCRSNEYCHPWFNMCLVNRTAIYTTQQPSVERIDCNRDGDCQTDEYCHNMSHLCLQLRKANLNTPAPSKSSYRCTSDDDCKITEFCHILLSRHRHVAREPSRPAGCNGNKCVRMMQHTNSKIFGICIPKEMQMVVESSRNYVLNCSNDKDCGDGMCCMRTIGVCMARRLPGELCLAEVRNALITNYSDQRHCPGRGGGGGGVSNALRKTLLLFQTKLWKSRSYPISDLIFHNYSLEPR